MLGLFTSEGKSIRPVYSAASILAD